jgi:hypothetical protein
VPTSRWARLKANGDWSKWEEFQTQSNVVLAAYALVVIGGDEATVQDISQSIPRKPILRANLEPDALAAAPLIGREVVAFVGIARPDKF